MEMKHFVLSTTILIVLAIINYTVYKASNRSLKGHREYSTTFEVYITYLILYTIGWGATYLATYL